MGSCEFCGRDLTNREKEQCQPCKEDEEWLNAPLTLDEEEALKKRANEPLHPFDEEVPNGNL